MDLEFPVEDFEFDKASYDFKMAVHRHYDDPKDLAYMLALKEQRLREVDRKAMPMRGELYRLEEESDKLRDEINTLMDKFDRMTKGEAQ